MNGNIAHTKWLNAEKDFEINLLTTKYHEHNSFSRIVSHIC